MTRQDLIEHVACGLAHAINDPALYPSASTLLSTLLREKPVRDAIANAALNAIDRVDYTVTPAEPTEAMCDAARGLLLHFGSATRPGWTLRRHLEAGGYKSAGLTPEELDWDGLFPKEQRAAMVWRVMSTAANR